MTTDNKNMNILGSKQFKKWLDSGNCTSNITAYENNIGYINTIYDSYHELNYLYVVYGDTLYNYAVTLGDRIMPSYMILGEVPISNSHVYNYFINFKDLYDQYIDNMNNFHKIEKLIRETLNNKEIELFTIDSFEKKDTNDIDIIAFTILITTFSKQTIKYNKFASNLDRLIQFLYDIHVNFITDRIIPIKNIYAYIKPIKLNVYLEVVLLDTLTKLCIDNVLPCYDMILHWNIVSYKHTMPGIIQIFQSNNSSIVNFQYSDFDIFHLCYFLYVLHINNCCLLSYQNVKIYKENINSSEHNVFILSAYGESDSYVLKNETVCYLTNLYKFLLGSEFLRTKNNMDSIEIKQYTEKNMKWVNFIIKDIGIEFDTEPTFNMLCILDFYLLADYISQQYANGFSNKTLQNIKQVALDLVNNKSYNDVYHGTTLFKQVFHDYLFSPAHTNNKLCNIYNVNNN